MSDSIKVTNRDFEAMSEAIENSPEPNEELKKLFNNEELEEMIIEKDLEESIDEIFQQVNEEDTSKLPLGLRASYGRAIKALNKRNYFQKMLELHLKRVYKKAKLLYGEESQEYKQIQILVERLKGK